MVRRVLRGAARAAPGEVVALGALPSGAAKPEGRQ